MSSREPSADEPSGLSVPPPPAPPSPSSQPSTPELPHSGLSAPPPPLPNSSTRRGAFAAKTSSTNAAASRPLPAEADPPPPAKKPAALPASRSSSEPSRLVKRQTSPVFLGDLYEPNPAASTWQPGDPPPPPRRSARRLVSHQSSPPVVSDKPRLRQPDDPPPPPRRNTGSSLQLESRIASLPPRASTTSVTSSPDDSSADKLTNEQRRGKLVIEIYQTEKIYKGLLKDFREIFLAQLEVNQHSISHEFLNRPTLAGIFANMEQIEHLSDQLISELDSEFARWGVAPDAKHQPQQASMVRVGHLFESIAKLLPLYGQYVDNHAFATDDIEEFLHNDVFSKSWKKIIDATQQHSRSERSEKLDLASSFQGYLILPIQRVPRYVLLLKELQSCTEKICAESAEAKERYKVELALVKSALDRCTEVATEMNETIRRSQYHQQMVQLQKSIKRNKVDLLQRTALQEQRVLVRQGELVRVTQSSHKHKAFHFHLLSDMILYSDAKSNNQYIFHRCFMFSSKGQGDLKVRLVEDVRWGKDGLDRVRDYEKYMAYEQEGGSGSSRKSASMRLTKRLSTREDEIAPITVNDGDLAHRAFKIKFPTKDITLYARSRAEKAEWVRDIAALIEKNANSQHQDAVFDSRDIEWSKECKLCAAPLTGLVKWTSNTVCQRCGLQICQHCRQRKRVLVKGATAIQCCDLCRLEMDLTPNDMQTDRFRMLIHLEHLSGPLGLLASAGEERANPFAAAYFSLSHTVDRGEHQPKLHLRRGNSSVGQQAMFQVPVGPLRTKGDHNLWNLRVMMGKSGEVGNCMLDLSAVLCDKDMLNNREVEKTEVVHVTKRPNGDAAAHNDDEAQLEPIKLRIRYRLESPPVLWIAPGRQRPESPPSATRSSSGREMTVARTSSGREIARSLSGRSSPSSPGGMTRKKFYSVSSFTDLRAAAQEALTPNSDSTNDNPLEEEEAEKIEKRFRRFDVPSGLELEPSAANINKDLLIFYESCLLKNPCMVNVVCVDHLMSDYIRRLPEEDPRRVTLVNRLRLFHFHPKVREVDKEGRASAAVAVEVDAPLRPSAVSAPALVVDSLVADKYFKAALGSSATPPTASAALPPPPPPQQQILTQGDLAELLGRREVFLNELLKSEDEYVRRLRILSEVFVTPLMLVANGASVKSVVEGNEAGVVMSPKDKADSAIVADFVRARYVTVLLQSVRQILTVNTQLLDELQKAVRESTSGLVKVGHIFKRFAVVIKVYATFRTAYPEVVKDINEAPTQALSDSGMIKDLAFVTGTASGMIKDLASATGTAAIFKRLARKEDAHLVVKNFLEALAGNKEQYAKHLGPDVNKWKQESFLSLIRCPNERIQAYKRFLSALLINTPDTDPPHPDAEDLRQSLKLLNDADTQITQAGKLKEIYKELKAIEQILVGAPEHLKIGNSPSRRLLKQGFLVKRCRREDKLFYFWLFNDSLVYGHERRAFPGTFTYNRHMQLSSVGVDPYRNEDGSHRAIADIHSSGGLFGGRGESGPGDPNYAFRIVRQHPNKSMELMVPNMLLPSMDERSDDADESETQRRATPGDKERIKREWLQAFAQGEVDKELIDGAASWTSDRAATKCANCEDKFTFINRRHHCRKCGGVFCGKCSSKKLDLKSRHNEANVKPQRVCDKCFYDEQGGEDD